MSGLMSSSSSAFAVPSKDAAEIPDFSSWSTLTGAVLAPSGSRDGLEGSRTGLPWFDSLPAFAWDLPFLVLGAFGRAHSHICPGTIEVRLRLLDDRLPVSSSSLSPTELATPYEEVADMGGAAAPECEAELKLSLSLRV